jgi:hypothetical protein
MKSSKYFICRPVNGLANRLRVLFSYKIIAEYLKLPFYVYWTKSNGFDDSQLADLISVSDFEFVNESEWCEHRPVSFQIDKRITGTSEFKLDSTRLTKSELMSNLLMNGTFTKITAEVSNLPNWTFNDALVSKIPNHKKLYKKMVRSLSVSNKVKTESQQTMKLFDNVVLGVHLRFGDAMDFRNPKHKAHTKNNLNKIIDTCKNHTGKVFVSTDDPEVLNMFKNKLPNKLLFREKQFVQSKLNAQKNGQFDAMVDLYLLSQTNYMLPTSPSSFGKFASDAGGDLYKKFNNESFYNFTEYNDIIKW